ncbi:hypothetical protein [Streptomyces sp. NPDC058623]|uniref:hypothetical protein n=1 Tax=Streptomyces sp. NPDC058623 TaxID=3346563 RepID=UPI003659E5B6
MTPPRTAANRTVLAAVGLTLLLGGGWVASAHTSVAEHVPSGWTAPPDAPLLDRAALAELRTHPWWTPTVTAVGVLATLALGWWLIAQLRIRRPRLPLAAAGGSLRTRALEKALAERALTIDGISRCRTRIHVRRRHLHLRMRVWLEPETTPDTVVAALTALTSEAETAAAPYEIDLRLRMSHLTHRAPQVR